MPRIHETASGQQIKYADPDPMLARFLKRAEELASHADASENELIVWVYGPENPILDRTIFPERGAVTRAVLDDPVYAVLQDLLFRKSAAQRGQSLERIAAKYTLTVNEAAERKGVSPQAIRNAIATKRLPAWVRDGEYHLDPRTLDIVEFGSRLPKEEKRNGARSRA
jgi:hypothetical protein